MLSIAERTSAERECIYETTQELHCGCESIQADVITFLLSSRDRSFSYLLRNGLNKNAWNVRMCKYALENSKRFHKPSLPRCTFITLTNWHSTIAMYLVSIEIYSVTNGSTSIELLRAKQEMIKVFFLWEWTFEWCSFKQYNRMWGCWMLSLSGLSLVSKCDSMAIHEIFSDFDSSKCDLREEEK